MNKQKIPHFCINFLVIFNLNTVLYASVEGFVHIPKTNHIASIENSISPNDRDDDIEKKFENTIKLLKTFCHQRGIDNFTNQIPLIRTEQQILKVSYNLPNTIEGKTVCFIK